MLVAILQTSYLPWTGVIDMMDRCDLFVYHNDIYYNRSWRNRNRIRVPSPLGWSWLTVPVKLIDGSSRTLINRVQVANEHKWAKKHWSLIQEHYQKAPYFKRYAEPYKEVFLGKEWERLVDLNEALMDIILQQIGVECKIVYTEDLNLAGTSKNKRIIRICQQVGASTWLANSACRDYVVPELYQDSEMGVVFHDYTPPVYPQVYEPFVSHLSILDLIFSCGPQSLELIRSTRRGELARG